MAASVQAHGWDLKNLAVDAKRAVLLKAVARNLPDITLSDHHLCDFELMAAGAFSHLEGFMVRADYESAIDRMQLQDGTLWPIPICLDISENKARNPEAGQSVALRDPEGYLLAVLHVADIWRIDKEKESLAVYNTVDISHPGVRHLFNTTKEFYVRGRIEVISLPLHYDFKQLRRTPAEIRREHQKLGWQRVVGCHNKGIIHRAQLENTLAAMRQAKANLLMLPIVGATRTEDFDYFKRVRCNTEVMRHHPPETHILSLLPHFMRMAGPKLGVLNAITAKNYGCSHFVVCHDHAAPGKGLGKDRLCFYDRQESKAIFAQCREALGTSIITFEEMTYPPPIRQGFTRFLTGRSGGGKSQIAKVLYSKMLEVGKRPVTLLDGDIVRQHLSGELTFSKEHRDINVRRIGFMACEITKNRGIAICVPGRRSGRPLKAMAALSRSMWPRPLKSERNAIAKRCPPRPEPDWLRAIRASMTLMKCPRHPSYQSIPPSFHRMRRPRKFCFALGKMANHQVLVLDNLSTGHRELLFGGKFIQESMGDSALLDRIFSKNRVGAVMHFAAFSLVGEPVLQPLKYYRNNISETVSLIEAMLRHSVNRFVFSSTAAVYGEPAKKPIGEGHPCCPNNPYGVSKLCVERILADCDRAHGLKSIVLRYFNAAGADESGQIGEMHDPEAHLIPLVLKCTLAEKPIRVFGTDYPTPDGTCLRDYVHVTDLAQAHLLVLELLLNGSGSWAYNLGNSIGCSVRQVIELTGKVTGKKIQVVEENDGLVIRRSWRRTLTKSSAN